MARRAVTEAAVRGNPVGEFAAACPAPRHVQAWLTVPTAVTAAPLPPHAQVKANLPPAPHGQTWHRIVDTQLPSPRDFNPEGRSGIEGTYGIAPWSCLVLQAK